MEIVTVEQVPSSPLLSSSNQFVTSDDSEDSDRECGGFNNETEGDASPAEIAKPSPL